MPIGFITDTNGIPVMEEGPLPDEFNLLPLGATPELGSHKGYGLAAVSQILAGLLSNGAFGPYGMGHMSHCVAAYSIDAFTDVSRFKSDMDRFLRYLRETLLPRVTTESIILVLSNMRKRRNERKSGYLYMQRSFHGLIRQQRK